MAAIDPIDTIDILDTPYVEVPIGSKIVFRFQHNGNWFRVAGTKSDRHCNYMTAYAGKDGPMNNRNRIETRYVSGYNITLRECVEKNCRLTFEVNPTDIGVEVTPPKI